MRRLLLILSLFLGGASYAQENQFTFNAERIRTVAAAGGITCGAGGVIDEDFDGASSLGAPCSGTGDVAWTCALTATTVTADSATITDTHFANEDLSVINTADTSNADIVDDAVHGGAFPSDDIWLAFAFKFTAVSASTDNNGKYYLAHAQATGGTPGSDGGSNIGILFKLLYQTATTDFTASMIVGSEFGSCGSPITGITIGKVYIVQMTATNASPTCGWEIWDCGTNGASCSSLGAQSENPSDDPGVDFQNVAFGVVSAPSVFDDPYSLYYGFVKADVTAAICD